MRHSHVGDHDVEVARVELALRFVAALREHQVPTMAIAPQQIRQRRENAGSSSTNMIRFLLMPPLHAFPIGCKRQPDRKCRADAALGLERERSAVTSHHRARDREDPDRALCRLRVS